MKYAGLADHKFLHINHDLFVEETFGLFVLHKVASNRVMLLKFPWLKAEFLKI